MTNQKVTDSVRKINGHQTDIESWRSNIQGIKVRIDKLQAESDHLEEAIRIETCKMEKEISDLKDLLHSPKNFYPGSGPVVEMYGEDSQEPKTEDNVMEVIGREG